MPNLISFPFRLNNTGAVATWEDGSEDYYSEELAALALTKPGERILVPDYGITDPTFADFNETELAMKVDQFGPPVVISNIDSEYTGATQETITVTFQTDDSYNVDESAINNTNYVGEGLSNAQS